MQDSFQTTLYHIASQEQLKEITSQFLNRYPEFMFLSDPNTQFPGKFVIVRDNKILSATLIKVAKEIF